MATASSNTEPQDRNDAEIKVAGGQMGYGNSRNQDGQMEQDVALSQAAPTHVDQHIAGETSGRPGTSMKAAANRPLNEGDRGSGRFPLLRAQYRTLGASSHSGRRRFLYSGQYERGDYFQNQRFFAPRRFRSPHMRIYIHSPETVKNISARPDSMTIISPQIPPSLPECRWWKSPR